MDTFFQISQFNSMSVRGISFNHYNTCDYRFLMAAYSSFFHSGPFPFYHKFTNHISCGVRGKIKVAPLSFLHGCRNRRLKD
jgi:hypothetical protein